MGFPELLPHIGKHLCIPFYTNVLQSLIGLTCSPVFHPWLPQASRQKKRAGATAGSSFSSYIFYPQRVLKKWLSCSPAGTWPAAQSRWISSSSCQAALVLFQTHVITCNMDTIPSFLRAPGPSRRKRRQKIKHEGTEDRGAAVAVCVWNRKMNTREETGQGDNYFHPNFIPTIPNHFWSQFSFNKIYY